MPEHQETCTPITFTDNEWLVYRRAHQQLFDQVAAMEALQHLTRLESHSIVSSCLGCNYPDQNLAPLLLCLIRLNEARLVGCSFQDPQTCAASLTKYCIESVGEARNETSFKRAENRKVKREDFDRLEALKHKRLRILRGGSMRA